MKNFLGFQKVIAATTIANSLVVFQIPEAQALPLQTGIYSIGASSHIMISSKGQRYCFAGFSNNGRMIASLYPDPDNPGFYRLNGNSEAGVYQEDVNTLLWGSPNDLLPVSRNRDMEAEGSLTDKDVQTCLNSSKPFYRQYKPIKF